MDGIFKQIGTSDRHRVTASMLEIYEEKVIDLLCINRECLQIRESKGAVFVSFNFSDTFRNFNIFCDKISICFVYSQISARHSHIESKMFNFPGARIIGASGFLS